MKGPSRTYLRGLNTIRFLAAFFVLIGHGYQALLQCRIVTDNTYVVFGRATAAVELFFTLSGFLITYLLLRELESTGAVDIKFFYLRRILLIWPLYFLALTA